MVKHFYLFSYTKLQATTLIIDNKDDFKHILRIFNTNIDGRRRVPFALRAIKGIGRRFAMVICKV